MSGTLNTPSVYLADPDVTLWHGDALETLRGLPDESVHCVATSPPFFGLRDYGTGRWEGGDEGCDHLRTQGGTGRPSAGANLGNSDGRMPMGGTCSRCGARRIDQQIGLEASPDLWAARLVEVFREARRVLRRDGSLWIECGDSYASNVQGAGQPNKGHVPNAWQGRDGELRTKSPAGNTPVKHPTKPKDLIGQPFLLAFALRADGWYWRGCNIWAKPNAMPESAKDRCTVAHSYVLHFSKKSRYWFDGDAISEPAAWERWGDQTVPKHEGTDTAAGWIPPRVKTKKPDGWDTGAGGHGTIHRQGRENGAVNEVARTAKHPRSVWQIPTQGYAEAHFATWPEALARRIILAACPEGGTVLDPFGGSGTTALVARKHGRRAILIELNEEYCEMAAKRLAQQSLLTELAS